MALMSNLNVLQLLDEITGDVFEVVVRCVLLNLNSYGHLFKKRKTINKF